MTTRPTPAEIIHGNGISQYEALRIVAALTEHGYHVVHDTDMSSVACNEMDDCGLAQHLRTLFPPTGNTGSTRR